jgi:FecR protein
MLAWISVPRIEWAGALGLVAAVLLVAGVRSAEAAEGWRVREQPGTLQYRLPESSAWSPAAPGMELQPGTTVRAGSGRPAVLGQDGSSIVIRGGTELTLPSTGTETVVQRLGSARYQIEPGSVSDFLVETPYLVIGIKGTIFEVLVNEAGTKVGVSEGRVEVTTPDRRFRAELAPGQTARVRAAAGSAPEVQSEAGGTNASAPQDPTESAPPDQAASSDIASPQDPTGSALPDQAASPDVAAPPAQAEVHGALSPVTSVTRSLWSGIGGLLSRVDIVYDDRLPAGRRGTVVRTLSGRVASIGTGARGDSAGGSGGDAAGGSSSGGAGGGSEGGSSGGGGASSSGGGEGDSSGSSGSGSSGGSAGSSSSVGGGAAGSSGSGSGGSGRGGGGLGGAVGGVSSAVGGAVGGVSSAVGGAVGGGLGSAVGSVGRGLGGAVGGLGKGLGGALGGGGKSGGGKSGGGKNGKR